MRTNWDYIELYKEEVSALIEQRLEELYADKNTTGTKLQISKRALLLLHSKNISEHRFLEVLAASA
jgi:hypothetical protein